MNISVCITTFNEEDSISNLLDSLLSQSLKPQEIIIVDSKSSDKTVEIIRHYQKKDKRIKLLVEKSTRGRARNISIDLSRSETVALTDAGCIPKKDWLKNLTEPFKKADTQVVAGFYEMESSTPFKKSASVFLGVLLNNFSNNFLPSTRSMAMTKSVWNEVGGFNDKLNIAEDTEFSNKLLKNNIHISRVKNAIVEWGMPNNINEFFRKISNYSKGDVLTKIWIMPSKDHMSHNVHSLLVFIRTLFLLSLLIIFLLNSLPYLDLLVLFPITAYFYFSVKKAGLWGIILQPVSDIAVIIGFVYGFYQISFQRN